MVIFHVGPFWLQQRFSGSLISLFADFNNLPVVTEHEDINNVYL